jgi:choline dehydrogenase-like flavoprotein
VMPLITSANTHAPTMMIAERCADEVLASLGARGSALATAA